MKSNKLIKKNFKIKKPINYPMINIFMIQNKVNLSYL